MTPADKLSDVREELLKDAEAVLYTGASTAFSVRCAQAHKKQGMAKADFLKEAIKVWKETVWRAYDGPNTSIQDHVMTALWKTAGLKEKAADGGLGPGKQIGDAVAVKMPMKSEEPDDDATGVSVPKKKAKRQ